MTIDTFNENDPTLIDRGDDFVPTDDAEVSGGAGDEQDEGAAEREAAAATAKAEQDAAAAQAAADEAGKAAEAKPDDKQRMIPHSRFNEVNEEYKAERDRRLALEEELARLRGEASAKPPKAEEKQPEQAPAFDFDAKEDAYHNAILEGDTTTAKAIRGEIRAAERAEAERIALEKAQAERKSWEDAQTKAEQERATKAAQEAYAATVQTIFSLHPQLDDQHDSFDKDLMGEVKDWRDLYMSRGEKPGDALTKAVAKVIPAAAALAAPAAPAKATPEQIKRNLEADTKQPPEMGGVGERARKVDFAKLSEGEFNKLSDEDKRRARGDFV